MSNSVAAITNGRASVTKPEEITDSKINSTKLLKNLNSAAKVLAELRENRPNKVKEFLTSFRQVIEDQGLKALSNLKKIALALVQKLGYAKTETISVKTRSTTNAPRGFLWKPVADSPPHGLAILTPTGWNNEIKNVQVISPDGSGILATGKFSGVGNGEREHYRFSNKGSSFPDDSFVRIVFKNGQERLIAISDTSARFEGRN